jgi:hypothetical protein
MTKKMVGGVKFDWGTHDEDIIGAPERAKPRASWPAMSKIEKGSKACGQRIGWFDYGLELLLWSLLWLRRSSVYRRAQSH